MYLTRVLAPVNKVDNLYKNRETKNKSFLIIK